MKDMNAKKTVSLSKEEMKEILGGDAKNFDFYCQQLTGGVGCAGRCEPIFDLPNHTTRPQHCAEIGKLPTPDGESLSMCDCI